MIEITNRVIAKGYTKQLLEQTIRDYEDLGVWQISSNRSELRFIV